MGSFNGWTEGVPMTQDARGLFYCQALVGGGAVEFKFRVNGSAWRVSSAAKVVRDGSGNLNNLLEAPGAHHLHDDLVDLRRYFAGLKLKLGSRFKKLHVDMVRDDVCVAKRLCKSFKSSYVLVARLNHDPAAPPVDFDYELPGWVYAVKRLFFFDGSTEVLAADVPRLRCVLRETNDLSQFGYVAHR